MKFEWSLITRPPLPTCFPLLHQHIHQRRQTVLGMHWLAVLLLFSGSVTAFGQTAGSSEMAQPSSVVEVPAEDTDTLERDLNQGDLVELEPKQEHGPRGLTFQIYWENDSSYTRFVDGSDEYYTNGLALSLTWQPTWGKDLAKAIPFNEYFGPARHAVGFTFGQLMFTPSDIEDPNPRPNDEPYAGYLYGGFYFQRSTDTVAAPDAIPTLDHFQIDIGVIGKASGAGWAQESVHEAFNFDEPRGWEYQLNDEVTVQFTYRKKWRFELLPENVQRETGLQFQAIPGGAISLGTVYRNVEAGALFRLGFNLPDDYGPGRLADLPDGTGRPLKGWSFYGFGRLTGQIVQHNVFLDGNNFRNSISVGHNTFYGEGQLGVSCLYGGEDWTLGLTYSQTYGTEKFSGQNGIHGYGAFVLRYTAWF